MIDKDLGTQRDGISRGHGVVGPDLDCELVKVRLIADTRVLDAVVDLQHRGVDRVNRDGADGHRGVLVPVCRDIAAAVIQNQFHVQRTVRSEMGNHMIRVEDFHFRVGLDVAGRYRAFSRSLEIDGLGTCGMESCENTLDVQDDLGHIFHHAGDRGKLMLDTGNLHTGECRAGERREQHSAERISERCTVAALQRFHHILAVCGIGGGLDAFNTRLLYFNHR